MTTENESKDLRDLQKKMEANLKAKTQKRNEDKAEELGVSAPLLKYLEVLEERVEKLERKVEKLHMVRD